MFAITMALLLIVLALPHVLAIPTPEFTQETIKPSGQWSTEAILALIGLFVAVLCCAVSLMWPRRWRVRRDPGHRTSSCKLVGLRESL